MAKAGYVYILSNPSMPGLIKIGHANDLDRRMRELCTTGVPMPFVNEFAILVENCHSMELEMHNLFNEYRVENSEFFKMPVDLVVAALKSRNPGALSRGSFKDERSHAEKSRQWDKEAMERYVARGNKPPEPPEVKRDFNEEQRIRSHAEKSRQWDKEAMERYVARGNKPPEPPED